MLAISTLWAWLLGVFTKERIGVLFLLLFKSTASSIAANIANKQLQRKSLEFVRELAKREDFSNAEKAKIFNAKLAGYASSIGKTLGDSVLNCLRELAVNALKAGCGR